MNTKRSAGILFYIKRGYMSNNEIREKRKKVICDLVKDDFTFR